MSLRGFGRWSLLRRSGLVALALLGGIACRGAAEASTIYTYNFSQAFGPTGNPINVSGNFSGTADVFDHISLGTLIDFHVEASGASFHASYSGLPDFFSYKIGDTIGTTLSILSLLPDPTYTPLPHLCTGVATAIFCKTDAAIGAIAITITLSGDQGVLAASTVAPTVTLVSAISATPVATTPIPGALFLFMTALGGLGALGAWWRKPAAA
jgi:hypothetical protein